MITHGSLFTGRGGFDIGAEAADIPTLWNCEIDYFLRIKLQRLYPYAKQYTDVRCVSSPQRVNIISAGFPCQDISISNQRDKQGIRGHRSGLWSEVQRITSEIKPDYLLLENSPEIIRNGMEYLLSDLSAIGYDAEWHCLRASDFGYPHQRRRCYIIAYPSGVGRRSVVLQPPGTIALSQAWIPTASYLRVSGSRSKGFRDTGAIQRDDVIPHFDREIHAFGNAVMPIVAEHLFKCIQKSYE